MAAKQSEFVKEMQSRIQQVQEMELVLKMVIYGDSGVGKTTVAALSPKPIIISVEPGLASLNKLKKFMPPLDIQTYPADSMEDLRNIYTYLKEEKHDRKTVVIDSLSEAQGVSLDEILDDPKRDTDKYPRDTPILRDYGRNTQQMRKLVRKFRDLPMNVIFLCLKRYEKDEETGKMEVIPDLTPKLANDVYGYVDIVGYMYVADEDGTRQMLVQPHKKFQAKNRFGKLGRIIEEPTVFEMLHTLSDGEIPIPDNLDEIKKGVKENG